MKKDIKKILFYVLIICQHVFSSDDYSVKAFSEIIPFSISKFTTDEIKKFFIIENDEIASLEKQKQAIKICKIKKKEKKERDKKEEEYRKKDPDYISWYNPYHYNNFQDLILNQVESFTYLEPTLFPYFSDEVINELKPETLNKFFIVEGDKEKTKEKLKQIIEECKIENFNNFKSLRKEYLQHLMEKGLNLIDFIDDIEIKKILKSKIENQKEEIKDLIKEEINPNNPWKKYITKENVGIGLGIGLFLGLSIFSIHQLLKKQKTNTFKMMKAITL